MLLGVVAEARLREYVGRVAESGQGVLTIESRPHVDWMHAGWWRDVDIVLDECKKRGLKMMVFDDYWWPSQGMRGKYPIPPEFHCRDVKGKVYATKDAPSGKVANEIARVRVKEVRKGAFDVVPDGDKTIVYTWVTTKGGLPFPTVNGLDEAAVDWFLANMYQPYYDRYAASFRDGTIIGFFFDEPEFCGWWGDALAKELAARGDDVGGERSAAVTVNGAYAGGFIGVPYRIDITRAVKAGANTLEAKPFRLTHPKIVVKE